MKELFGERTWASKKLYDRLSTEKLDAVTASNRISIKKSYGKSELEHVRNAVEKFLASKTSTVGGVNKVRKTKIKEIAINLGIDDTLDISDAEFLYDIFGDSNFKSIKKYIIPESEILVLVQEAREQNWNRKTFLERADEYIITENDKNIKNKMKSIYNKYVKKGKI